jgi:hypothetical protein
MLNVLNNSSYIKEISINRRPFIFITNSKTGVNIKSGRVLKGG